MPLLKIKLAFALFSNSKMCINNHFHLSRLARSQSYGLMANSSHIKYHGLCLKEQRNKKKLEDKERII